MMWHLVAEALHIDRLRQQVVEGEHIRQHRAAAVLCVGDLAESRTSVLSIFVIVSSKPQKVTGNLNDQVKVKGVMFDNAC